MVDITKGIFLLILTIASNFNAETLSCKTREFLGEHMYAKHILNLLLVYFAIDLTNGKHTDPKVIMLNSFYVWIGLILFAKMNTYFTALAFMILVAMYVMSNYISYYDAMEHKNDDDKKKLSNLKKAKGIMMKILPAIIIAGFAVYTRDKHKEYGDKFDPLTFILGNTKCRNDK
jgi:hypothetical protein